MQKTTENLTSLNAVVANASQLPVTYYCRHMKEGVARYLNEDLYVGMDAIKRMAKTFCQPNIKPVFVHHQDVPIDQVKDKADGYVVESFYNEVDGWFWTKVIVTSDEGHKAVADGWAVSNAYIPTEFAGGGTCLNVPFNREVLNGEFTHLAIVPNPRYEDACIMGIEEFKAYNEMKREQLNELRNSKDEPKESKREMLKFFKREKVEVSNTSEIPEDAFVELDGKEVTIVEMRDAYLNAKAEEAEKENAEEETENSIDMETKVNMGDGEEMTIAELINEYKSLCEKKNSESEDEKSEDEEKENADEDAKDEEKENSLEAEKEAEEEETEIVNSIKDAISKGQSNQLKVVTKDDAVSRGKEKY